MLKQFLFNVLYVASLLIILCLCLTFLPIMLSLVLIGTPLYVMFLAFWIIVGLITGGNHE